ncbi:MAG: hypothetical protein ACLP1X_12745 [Polyangiaceae bacterium]|jgi:hypothetical protein
MSPAVGRTDPDASVVSRDQGESAFSPILIDLVARMPGARAAALVDVEGETVDYAGTSPPYEVRLAAAHWRIVLQRIHEQATLSGTRTLAVRAARKSFVLYALPQRYALVLVLSCGAGLASWRRALPACARRLAVEAGWPQPDWASWYPVEVACDERRRPSSLQIGGRSVSAIEILGALAGGLSRDERGWRVRCDREEVTLVREAGGFWYSDEPLLGASRESR